MCCVSEIICSFVDHCFTEVALQEILFVSAIPTNFVTYSCLRILFNNCSVKAHSNDQRVVTTPLGTCRLADKSEALQQGLAIKGSGRTGEDQLRYPGHAGSGRDYKSPFGNLLVCGVL